MHNRACEQPDLTGFFDSDGYRIPDCPMFHRSSRIANRPADRPARSDLKGNSAYSSTTRTVRHGRNRHSSGILTFFSFEEGSNFVQNIRPKQENHRCESIGGFCVLCCILQCCDSEQYTQNYTKEGSKQHPEFLR